MDEKTKKAIAQCAAIIQAEMAKPAPFTTVIEKHAQFIVDMCKAQIPLDIYGEE